MIKLRTWLPLKTGYSFHESERDAYEYFLNKFEDHFETTEPDKLHDVTIEELLDMFTIYDMGPIRELVKTHGSKKTTETPKAKNERIHH